MDDRRLSAETPAPPRSELERSSEDICCTATYSSYQLHLSFCLHICGHLKPTTVRLHAPYALRCMPHLLVPRDIQCMHLKRWCLHRTHRQLHRSSAYASDSPSCDHSSSAFRCKAEAIIVAASAAVASTECSTQPPPRWLSATRRTGRTCVQQPHAWHMGGGMRGGWCYLRLLASQLLPASQQPPTLSLPRRLPPSDVTRLTRGRSYARSEAKQGCWETR
jgi:hypothetical protein